MTFIYIAPLTYGTPGYVIILLGERGAFTDILLRLTGDQVNSKRLLSSWTLHFAAKKTYDS